MEFIWEHSYKILQDEEDKGLENWDAEIFELNNTTLKWKELIDVKYYVQTYYNDSLSLFHCITNFYNFYFQVMILKYIMNYI